MSQENQSSYHVLVCFCHRNLLRKKQVFCVKRLLIYKIAMCIAQFPIARMTGQGVHTE